MVNLDRKGMMAPWQPGHAPNPKGRKRGGAYVSEWLNAFLIIDEKGKAKYTIKQLKRIAERDTAPARVMAAQRVLMACRDPSKWGKDDDGNFYYLGVEPEVGKAFESIVSRLEGKPTQSVTVEHKPDRTLAEVEAHLSMLLSDPRVKTLLALAEAATGTASVLPVSVDPLHDEQRDEQGNGTVGDDG